MANISRLIHELRYQEKSLLEKGADAFLKPARYLFRGKTITLLNGKIAAERDSYRRKSWIKTSLMILLLLPGLLAGIPLKGIAYAIAPGYIRRLTIPSPRKAEFDRVFSTPLFKPYREQLQACLRTELSNRPGFLCKLKQQPFLQEFRTLIEITNEKIAPTTTAHRAWHQRWLIQLRSLIHLKDKLPANKDSAIQEALQILDRLTLWMYTEVKLQDVQQQFLRLSGMQAAKHPLPFSSLSQLLEDSWKNLKANPAFNSYEKDFSPVHDTHLKGNLPFQQFSMGSAQLIYTGRVTRENSLTGDVEVFPEFLHYLDVLSVQNKRHLYVNLLNRTKGSERDISLKIEKTEDHKKSLQVVTLDNNSNFYKQEKEYENLENSAAFKETFFQRLFAADGSYYWSPKLAEDEWRQSCRNILEVIHQSSFAQKANLSCDERKAFIDQAHLSIIRALLKQASFANTTCKHSMDRGPRQAALLLSTELRQQPIAPPEKVNQFLTTILAPPLLTHNRVSLERFIKRTQNALRFQPAN